MPNYRRYRQMGGTYFFTLKTERNAPIFRDEAAVKLLGTILRETKDRWPFEIIALVLLHDHLHSMWSLPPSDANYSTRWAWLKKEFTKRFLTLGGEEQPTSSSRRKNCRRGVWQRRFWEHTIEEDDDFDNHFDYLHWNPAKHGYVTSPKDWPYSTFHRWVKDGGYELDWGRGGEPLTLSKIKDAGE